MDKIFKGKIRSSLGFTLLELLVALSIFAVVMVMVTFGLKAMLAFQTQVKIRDERLHQLQFALFLLERDFIQMIQYGNKAPSLLYSAPNAISFIRSGVVNPLARHARSTLKRVSYSVSSGVLIRHSSDLWVDLEAYPPISMPILQGVDEFQVRFWTHEKTWVDQWPEVGRDVSIQNSQAQAREGQKYSLPSSVNFTLKIKGKGLISRIFFIPPGDYYVSP